ncbi:type II secretion system minor pseudopilin GspI [Hylemonella gracilis]|uniref:Type II secretion system protein I n=1 Tax=Hylemonella gracilis ATCC 19624 TaxID=887062 RepID=F3KWB4_9BURK|nr:type II secretion system minor pseudopilin GspI [Hylemonella gracilis]EGI75913.1 general secretion pathway protein I [Hylemonella gracilis ATCC 19624]
MHCQTLQPPLKDRARLRRRRRGAQQGFTLIEVLVALSITGTALLAGLQGARALERLAERQTDQWLAQLCARNALTSLRLHALYPPTGEHDDSCVQMGMAYPLHLSINPTPNPSFRAVRVQVYKPQPVDGNPTDAPTSLLQLSTLVGRY